MEIRKALKHENRGKDEKLSRFSYGVGGKVKEVKVVTNSKPETHNFSKPSSKFLEPRLPKKLANKPNPRLPLVTMNNSSPVVKKERPKSKFELEKENNADIDFQPDSDALNSILNDNGIPTNFTQTSTSRSSTALLLPDGRPSLCRRVPVRQPKQPRPSFTGPARVLSNKKGASTHYSSQSNAYGTSSYARHSLYDVVHGRYSNHQNIDNSRFSLQQGKQQNSNLSAGFSRNVTATINTPNTPQRVFKKSVRVSASPVLRVACPVISTPLPRRRHIKNKQRAVTWADEKSPCVQGKLAVHLFEDSPSDKKTNKSKVSIMKSGKHDKRNSLTPPVMKKEKNSVLDEDCEIEIVSPATLNAQPPQLNLETQTQDSKSFKEISNKTTKASNVIPHFVKPAAKSQIPPRKALTKQKLASPDGNTFVKPNPAAFLPNQENSPSQKSAKMRQKLGSSAQNNFTKPKPPASLPNQENALSQKPRKTQENKSAEITEPLKPQRSPIEKQDDVVSVDTVLSLMNQQLLKVKRRSVQAELASALKLVTRTLKPEAPIYSKILEADEKEEEKDNLASIVNKDHEVTPTSSKNPPIPKDVQISPEDVQKIRVSYEKTNRSLDEIVMETERINKELQQLQLDKEKLNLFRNQAKLGSTSTQPNQTPPVHSNTDTNSVKINTSPPPVFKVPTPANQYPNSKSPVLATVTKRKQVTPKSSSENLSPKMESTPQSLGSLSPQLILAQCGRPLSEKIDEFMSPVESSVPKVHGTHHSSPLLSHGKTDQSERDSATFKSENVKSPFSDLFEKFRSENLTLDFEKAGTNTKDTFSLVSTPEAPRHELVSVDIQKPLLVLPNLNESDQTNSCLNLPGNTEAQTPIIEESFNFKPQEMENKENHLSSFNFSKNMLPASPKLYNPIPVIPFQPQTPVAFRALRQTYRLNRMREGVFQESPKTKIKNQFAHALLDEEVSLFTCRVVRPTLSTKLSDPVASSLNVGDAQHFVPIQMTPKADKKKNSAFSAYNYS
ncbi:uncharacterized protein LOC100177706 isoform X2 [Ciona intestinalis]